MFRNLIPLLGGQYHVIAPDYLGFGLSAMPKADKFDYTFDNLASLTAELLETIGISRYAMYVQDYGTPIGWRLALRNEGAVSAENEARVRKAFELDNIRSKYIHGVPDETLVSPDSWFHDFALISRPGNDEIQLKLFRAYATKSPLFPAVHEYFRRSQVPLLAVWGESDPIFGPAGARAFQKDLPDAEAHLFDGRHFLLESALDAVVPPVRQFLAIRVLTHQPSGKHRHYWRRRLT